jgi:exodeoxyribonuclease V alpha subunit
LESGEYLIIIDEASMLDLPTCYRILFRMPPGTRLLLVGDSAQLSPIGFGLTFHAMVRHPLIPTVWLTEIHRAAAVTGIPQASVAIRNGILPDLRAYAGLGEGISFVECTSAGAVGKISEVVAELGGPGSCQVIGAVKGGAAGIYTINRHFHDSLHGRSAHLFGYAEGEPVMWTRNDYERGLLNGSMGQVVGLGDHLAVDFDGDLHELGWADVRDLVHAYGITVHKAQGSQFERVVVPLFGNRLLDRTMIYTAVTRTSKQVVLVGDRRAFEHAVQASPLSAVRETGMLMQLDAFANAA